MGTIIWTLIAFLVAYYIFAKLQDRKEKTKSEIQCMVRILAKDLESADKILQSLKLLTQITEYLEDTRIELNEVNKKFGTIKEDAEDATNSILKVKGYVNSHQLNLIVAEQQKLCKLVEKMRRDMKCSWKSVDIDALKLFCKNLEFEIIDLEQRIQNACPTSGKDFIPVFNTPTPPIPQPTNSIKYWGWGRTLFIILESIIIWAYHLGLI